jgi:hypothetical protein
MLDMLINEHYIDFLPKMSKQEVLLSKEVNDSSMFACQLRDICHSAGALFRQCSGDSSGWAW